MVPIVDLSGATIARQIVAPSRTFQDYLTIEEAHSDESIVPEHPVEAGAVMSDHIYHRPPSLQLRLGWSNADLNADSAGYVNETYAALLRLKTNRQLFRVFTGKRIYNNMFVTSLRTRTDERFAYALVAECELRQMLLVTTATASGSPTNTTAAPSPDPTANSAPRKTQPTVDSGPTQGINQNLGSFNTLRTGTGDTLVPSGQNFGPVVATAEIPPLATPNDDGGGSGPVPFFVPFGM